MNAPSSLSMKLNLISGESIWDGVIRKQDTVNNLSGGTSGNQEPKRTFRVHLDAIGYIRGLSETS